MFSDDPADWIGYGKRQFRQILGRLTRVITGTLDPHLVRCPDDERTQLATTQLTGVRAASMTRRLIRKNRRTSGRRKPPSPG
ncbi:hypothetical protein ABZ434_22525 [Streptomyces sp. NPDC005761]|uniref:hypothetical protein n=1 Tax=unclassified Streptomyces TaxID=2593676 RepID=UPI0033FC5F58